MPQIEIRTLRQFIESDQVIDCDCSNYWVCSHSGPLQIELAAERFGGDFDFYQRRGELASHVYCSLCGKFHPTFRLGWKTRPTTYTGSHGARAALQSVHNARAPSIRWQEPADWMVGGTSSRKFGPRR